MGKILGIKIQNYGLLKDIKMGKLYSDQSGEELPNMVAVIGENGSGKSTFADAFGFISDCLTTDVETACEARNRGGYDQLVSQGSNNPIHFEIYYKETRNSRPITYELTIGKDSSGRPCVKEERLRQRRPNEKYGQPLTFLSLREGEGYAFEGLVGGQPDDGSPEGNKIKIELSDTRRLGIVTVGAMTQYKRIQGFLSFLKNWYLCYFNPEAARRIQVAESATHMQHLNRTGSNINNVVQYMYRENRYEFKKILSDVQERLPDISKIKPQKLSNGQMVLEFYQRGFDRPFYSQRMSDGTLKYLAYYLLLHEKNPRRLVFIEEPENGLYHQCLPDLAQQMNNSVGEGYSKQIFVTTHSPFFVNALIPGQVWVLVKNTAGFAEIKQAASYNFVKDLVKAGAPLGDLWYSEYFVDKEENNASAISDRR